MKSASLTKFFIISLLLHLLTVATLQTSGLFESSLPMYTNFEVTSSVSKSIPEAKTRKTFQVNSVSKSHIRTAAKTEVTASEAADSSTNKNLGDLPVPVEGILVTQGLIPLNLVEVNKTIKRTQSATEKNIEGVIKLKLLVDETGQVRAVTALSSLGYGLDEIAAAAAWRLIFKPARVDSRNVPLETIYSVKFDITHQ